MLYGYARVSTQEQETHAQTDALFRAGVGFIFSEKRSGGSTARRQELEKLLRVLQRGDTVVVYKLDRIVRSLKDLLRIIERIEERGAQFRSLTEALDILRGRSAQQAGHRISAPRHSPVHRSGASNSVFFRIRGD